MKPSSFTNAVYPLFHRRALATELHSTAVGASTDTNLPEGETGGGNSDIEKLKSGAGGGSSTTTGNGSTGSGTGTSSTVVAASFGLIKAMMGSGMLALPAGLAAVSDYPSALLPATVVMAIMAVLSAYTFSLYGRLTDQTQAKSLGDLWKKVMKQDQSVIISTFSFICCFGSLLAYGLVIGDSIASLATAGGLAGWMASRQTAILGITVGVLYPLCNLSNLASLAPVSIVGVVGTIVTTLFLALRCPAVVASSPYSGTAVPASALLRSMPATLAPSFSTYSKFKSPAPLILIAMACTSLMAHFSVPDFYHSLADKPINGTGGAGANAKSVNTKDSSSSKTLDKFRKMTIIGFLSVSTINTLTLVFGFLTFGGNSAGIILNNYSALDWGAALSRLLVVVSVIGGYPFLMSACRSEALELFCKGKEVTRGLELKCTTILLSILTCLGFVVKDAGFVVSFNGALMGISLIYVFPALLFLKQTQNAAADNRIPYSRSLRLERLFCRFLLGFGAVASVVGAGTSVVNSYFPHLLL
jgi:sodium-coupled neutral amino acid transporter 11